ncbi:MAG: UDP-N-acetylglucosamine 1-carboxyvinyltransferase [Candidatus Cloacimonetes bacterium]|nr:UDP-N-acetylglucosamine 1-carboxyvinyltransferase [Candidatus Cloacimonadota bacterium]
MEKFVINGGKTLHGSVRISGAKNAILPIMTATLLTSGKSILRNIPNLNDIKMMAHLLRIIGARVDFHDGLLEINTEYCSYYEAPYELVSKMRASIYVLGPLLSRFGQARVSFPGGCAIGTRPVDLHLQAMEALGSYIDIEHGYINARCKKLQGNRIKFPKSSVGATANALMAAVTASGRTEISGAALEPEIASLIDFLTLMGARIRGKDTDQLIIDGVAELHPVEMEMIPDRIETGTFLIAGAITHGDITVENCFPDHLSHPLELLKKAGCNIKVTDTAISLHAPSSLKAIDIITKPYPGFPTDLQAQFMALLCLATGTSTIKETIFPERFMHVAELNRLDADISLKDNIATVKGVPALSGAPVMANDLRASAALVLAGLAAQGQTEISRIYHIDRGYEHIEFKLNKLGADIKRIQG